MILPRENACECSAVEGLDVFGVTTLQQVGSFLHGTLDIDPYELDGTPYMLSQAAQPLDFVDVRGQEAVMRAVTIACGRR